MQARIPRRIAWAALGLFTALAGVGMVLVTLNGNRADLVENAFFVVVFVAIGTTGCLLASRVPRNAIGWIFLSSACLAAVGFVGGEYAKYALATRPGSLPGAMWGEWLGNWIWAPAILPLITLVPLLFPDGRVLSSRWRPVVWSAAASILLAAGAGAVRPGPFEDSQFTLPNPAGIPGAKPFADVAGPIGFLGILVVAILAVISLVIRYRRAEGEDRQRFKWLVYGLLVLGASFIVQIVLSFLSVTSTAAHVIFDLGFLALPIGAGMAILKHRLYDIDVVVNRTVVVGALAAFVTVVYVALVVGIGAAVVGSRANTFLTLLAAVVIAVAFQPVRARAEHFANRLVFGKRATPYEVLSEFAERIGGGYGPDDLLLQMARTIGEGVGATAAHVWLRVGSDLQVAGSWPARPGSDSTVRLERGDVPAIRGADGVYPVRQEGELLGALSVTKPRGDRLTQTEDKLVADLAAQAGLVLRNVRLIEELRASRQRIVSASDAERRRLERNIHDGARQQLVALAMKLRLARDFARRDVDRAEGLLDDVQVDTQAALDTLRDLARGIYPPLLADEGLAAALSAQARRAAIPVTVESDGIGRYPQDVEAAVYFCCLEAVQNAAKYGGGAPTVVSLSEEGGTLTLRVADQGPGFDPDTTASGSGLQNMRDRLEALGGSLEISSHPGSGTVVSGRIPGRAG